MKSLISFTFHCIVTDIELKLYNLVTFLYRLSRSSGSLSLLET
jgi:hypothetical protein